MWNTRLCVDCKPFNVRNSERIAKTSDGSDCNQCVQQSKACNQSVGGVATPIERTEVSFCKCCWHTFLPDFVCDVFGVCITCSAYWPSIDDNSVDTSSLRSNDNRFYSNSLMSLVSDRRLPPFNGQYLNMSFTLMCSVFILSISWSLLSSTRALRHSKAVEKCLRIWCAVKANKSSLFLISF